MTTLAAPLTPVLQSADGQATVYLGDCLDVLRQIPDASVHAVITDPPYGLSQIPAARVTDTVVRWATGDREFIPDARGFKSAAWDAFVPPPAVFDECLRILKPGGHLLAFAGTRTVDLMGLSIRLAGFDIRDSLAWAHSQGFPKGQDIGARIDKAAGATREVVGRRVHPTLTNQPRVRSAAFHADTLNSDQEMESWDLTAPATAEAARWTGWSNALKPAFEPILLAQKPFSGPLYRNVLEEGVGGLNIAATRIAGEPVPINRLETWSGFGEQVRPGYEQSMNNAGRYPTNLFLDEDQAAALNDQTGALTSRFFYVAKPAKSERPVAADGTRHPTTKPLALMRQLARLITPAGGTIIDPFAGSGTTVEAGLLEGFNVIGVEREPVFVELIGVRMDRTAAARA